MNPPFHDARRHNASPDPGRRLAHSGEAGLLKRWVDSAAWLLKTNGCAGADLARGRLGAMSSKRYNRCSAHIAVLHVHPREDAAPIRVLVRARKEAAFR
jgi:tRNA1(Val) A37 N6-methylase TrmN6